MLVTLLAALAVTCVNPYGLSYWTYLVSAWLHPRADVPEWGRTPVWGFDPYFGFQILFLIVLVAVALGWKRRTRVGLIMLALTAAAGWPIGGTRHFSDWLRWCISVPASNGCGSTLSWPRTL